MVAKSKNRNFAQRSRALPRNDEMLTTFNVVKHAFRKFWRWAWFTENVNETVVCRLDPYSTSEERVKPLSAYQSTWISFCWWCSRWFFAYLCRAWATLWTHRSGACIYHSTRCVWIGSRLWRVRLSLLWHAQQILRNENSSQLSVVTSANHENLWRGQTAEGKSQEKIGFSRSFSTQR